MENSKNRILIALAGFIIVILLSNYLVVNPAYAVSLFELDMGSADGSTKTFWIPSISKYIVGNPASNANYYVIDPVAHTKTLVTKPVIAGRSPVGGIACTTTVCYDIYFGGDPEYYVTYTPLTGALLTQYSVSTSQDGSNPTIIISGVTFPSGALYRDGWGSFGCASGSVLVRYDGAVLGSCAGVKPSIGSSGLRVAGDLVGLTKSDPTGTFQIWRITTASLVCTVSSVNAKSLERYNSNWYVVIGTTTINKYNDSCSAGTGITGTGLSNQFVDIRLATNEGVMLVRDTANLVGMSLNSTNISSRLFSIPMNHTEEITPPLNSGDYATAQHQYGFDSNPTAGNDKFVFVQLGTAESGGGGGGGNGTFCSQPENANILICRNGGSGEIGSAGAFIVGNITQGTGVLGIGCSIGLVDCTSDSNPQTNGLGLLIFIASIFVVVGMFYYSGGLRMPLFIWAIIIISLSAFFTITGLINPIFLILSIIAIIALTAPKIIDYIRGGEGGFGGGSSG